MDFSSLKLYFSSLIARWNDLKPLLKIGLASLIVLLPVLIFLAIAHNTSTTYTVLFSANQIRTTDLPKVKSYLDALKIPYKVNEDNLLLIPKSQEQQARLELASYGLPRNSSEKGFEIFDSTTWIKGEKELQVLELRALKGQLERDLSHFENVRQASVIIDIPPAKTFGGTTFKTKASVILDLVPGARLSQQELRSITYHVTGAVRGLTPDMVAISDTTGRLYQGLDYDGSQDSIRGAEVAAEDYLKAKIDGMLTAVLGFDNFYSNIQVSMNRDKITEERQIYSGTVDGVPLGQPVVSSVSRSNDQQAKIQNNPLRTNFLEKPTQEEKDDFRQTEQLAVPTNHVKIISTPGKIRSISIAVLIDERILNPEVYSYHDQYISYGRNKDDLKKDIENQITTILKGYKTEYHQAVNFISFDRPPKPKVSVETVTPQIIPETSTNTFLIVLIAATVLAILIMLFRLQRPRYIASLSERENYLKKTEKKSIANLEEMLDVIRARYQNNPNAVIGTLHGWMQEDKL